MALRTAIAHNSGCIKVGRDFIELNRSVLSCVVE